MSTARAGDEPAPVPQLERQPRRRRRLLARRRAGATTNGSPERNCARSPPSPPTRARPRREPRRSPTRCRPGAALLRVALLGEQPPGTRRSRRASSRRTRPRPAQQDRALAEPLDRGRLVRDEHDRAAALLNSKILPKHLRWNASSPTANTSSSSSTSACDVHRDREAEPHVHPRRVRAHGQSMNCSSSANATISSSCSRT